MAPLIGGSALAFLPGVPAGQVIGLLEIHNRDPAPRFTLSCAEQAVVQAQLKVVEKGGL